MDPWVLVHGPSSDNTQIARMQTKQSLMTPKRLARREQVGWEGAGVGAFFASRREQEAALLGRGRGSASVKCINGATTVCIHTC